MYISHPDYVSNRQHRVHRDVRRDDSGGAETLFGGVKEHEVPLDGSKIGECKNTFCLFFLVYYEVGVDKLDFTTTVKSGDRYF